MQHKKQHWVPQSYLKAWIDPETPKGQSGYVWVFDKDGETSKKRNPKNIFHESEMYTILNPNGSRCLEIEHGLAGLEDLFADTRTNYISKRKDLSQEQKLITIAFIAASFSRSKLQRDNLKEQWRRIAKFAEDMKKQFEKLSPLERQMASPMGISSGKEGLSLEDAKRLATNPLQETLPVSIDVQVELLLPMNLCILCTDDDPGFITSDAPCVWWDSESYKRPAMFRSPGLIYPTIEITLPISPNQLALLSWFDLKGYIDIPCDILDDYNRRTRYFSQESFIVKRNYKKDIWLDPGKPDDVNI